MGDNSDVRRDRDDDVVNARAVATGVNCDMRETTDVVRMK